MTAVDRRSFLTSSALATTAATGALLGLGAGPAGAAGIELSIDPGETYPLVPELVPFGHGVMSGDPLADRVILWTRITIPDPRGFDATVVADPQGITEVPVGWVLARDPGLADVVRSGSVTTTAARDWTVKVDADELPSATTLYYAFSALGFRSPIGRTRTAPAMGDAVTELTIAHVACTSWWQDVFNGYGRIGARDDLDLVVHAGDHVYETSGGHPASRFWKGQTAWEADVDNGPWRTVAQARRRYALYYADPQMLRAHLAAPWAIMPDQHDDDPDLPGITTEQARQVMWEWCAMRQPRADHSGAFDPSPGPDVNLPIPAPADAGFIYRHLPHGRLADVVLIDVRRFANRPGDAHKVLGDRQDAWLRSVLLDSKARGVTHRVIVNQVNLSQLRAGSVPVPPEAATQLGLLPEAPQGAELYTTAWGGRPAERTELYAFLLEHGIVDNVVLSGDSHGFFGSDLVADPTPASGYVPLVGGPTVVGVEMVGSTMGRPGFQDVIAEMAYFARTGGSRGAAYTDAATFDRVDRPAALGPTLAVEQAAKAGNPNLIFFDWRADYGYAMAHLRTDRSVLEALTTPQRQVSADQALLAQLASPVGAPHLTPVPLATPLAGTRQDEPPPPAATAAEAPDPVVPEVPFAIAAPLAAAAAAFGGALALRTRRSRAGTDPEP